MSAKKRSTANEEAYLHEYACLLGRLFANLASLELSLRALLYDRAVPPHEPFATGQPPFAAEKGDELPVNALTSWASLGELVGLLKESADPHGARITIPDTLKRARDALAHGRIVRGEGEHLVLLRFSRPLNGGVRVEDRLDLSLEYMKTLVGQAHDALIAVHALRTPNGARPSEPPAV